MTYNFNEFKVPVFQNINDKPIEPTATKAGNGADVINRFNSLVDQLQFALNSLLSALPVYEWSLVLPTINTVQAIDVYHLNTSESRLYASDFNFNSESHLAKSFVVNYDFTPAQEGNTIINISDLIKTTGCGYYFFIASDFNNQFIEDLKLEVVIEANPLGAVRILENFVPCNINDSQGAAINLNIKPLVITQTNSVVAFSLANSSSIPPEQNAN